MRGRVYSRDLPKGDIDLYCKKAKLITLETIMSGEIPLIQSHNLQKKLNYEIKTKVTSAYASCDKQATTAAPTSDRCVFSFLCKFEKKLDESDLIYTSPFKCKKYKSIAA